MDRKKSESVTKYVMKEKLVRRAFTSNPDTFQRGQFCLSLNLILFATAEFMPKKHDSNFPKFASIDPKKFVVKVVDFTSWIAREVGLNSTSAMVSLEISPTPESTSQHGIKQQRTESCGDN